MMKITGPGYVQICNDAGGTSLHRHIARVVVAAIDAGHLDAIRHFAEHGTLPTEAPVWSGATVTGNAAEGWAFVNGRGIVFARCRRHADGYCADRDGVWPRIAETPQKAVDALRTTIREFYCCEG